MLKKLAVLAVVSCLAASANAAIIEYFTPVAGGYISFNNIWAGGFNNQQGGTTLDTTDLTWIDNYSGIGIYTNRKAWLDFGPDWASVKIDAVWTGFTRSSGSRLVEDWIQDAWWDADNNGTNDLGLAATEVKNIFNAFVGPSGGLPEWVQQSTTGFTPKQRYLILHTTSTSVNPWSQRVNEIIFQVPEPATMSLLGLGAVALLRRRK